MTLAVFPDNPDDQTINYRVK